MKHNLFYVLAFGAVVLPVSAQNGPKLEIYSAPKDTVSVAKAVLVAVTDPGATAIVNDVPVHVYKTGSFGTELQFQPGFNDIQVSVNHGGQTNSVTKTVYYAPELQTQATPTSEPVTVFYDEPVYVSTTDGAYLQYGNGGDRLGGSKMGFIDADIPLKVIGEAGYIVESEKGLSSKEKAEGHFSEASLYCVRLGANRLAYIPKEYTVPTQNATRVVNTGSWSVTNTGKSDRVVIGLPVRLPYQYSTSINPQTITIDIFGATDNSNWITQRSATLGIIDFVDFEQVSDDIYRVILRLKDKYQWGYTVGYEGNSLVVNVRHRPTSLSLKDLTIGLDAGHGGEFPGAVSPSGIKEKDVNLDIVLRVRNLLEKKGARVVLTRTGDQQPSMADRKKTWRDAQVDLAVSVHNNSGGSALSSPGTSVLYKHLSDRTFGQCMLRRMLETELPLFGLVQNFNFSLNAPTDCPNVLIEGMFMSSLAEEEKLADPKFRQTVAEKIVAGIEDYLNSAK